MQCVTCDQDIDGHAESAAARYVGAGFCDQCIQSRSMERSETTRSLFERRAYSFKEHPALSEINSSVSEVLRYSMGQENDAIAIALIKQCDISALKEARFELLCRVIDNIHEGQALKDMPPTKFNKSKRCDNLNRCASDIVELFRYVSCLSDDVPSCLFSKIQPPAYTDAAQPKITDMCNKSVRRPIPAPRGKVSPANSPIVTPPPPPPPPNDHATLDSESLRLYLNYKCKWNILNMKTL